MKLWDPPFYDRLQRELRTSMRALVADACEQLENDGALPVHVFRAVAAALPDDAWLGFKAVGWAEELNDLCYFAQLLGQVRAGEIDAETVFAECEEQFYEN